MSSDRRERTRYPARSTTRQEWVPRGSSASVVNAPRRFINLNMNGVDEDSRNISTSDDNRRTRNVALRGQNEQFTNHQRGRVRGENQDKKVLKDPNLPQLVLEIQDKLMKGKVECMICYDMVRRSAPIWSCSSCFSIFHLNCIKKWARAPTSVDLSADKSQGFNWRCPGCQSVQLTASKEIRYVCFCGQRTDPPADFYLTPHSCGEPCGKPLESAGGSEDNLCPHKCVLQCHPGPCPPCKAFAPQCLCPCGKKMITTRCSDRKSLLTCGHQCNKHLECHHHKCENICHVGPCGPCQVLVSASCFCKNKVDLVHCGDMAVKGEVKADTGVFSCSSTCGKMLSCGHHSCGEICHPGPCGDCESSSSKIQSCFCGKTSLQEQRNSCLDPIPACSEICGKALACGLHHCNELCHARNCPPCLVYVSQKCRCGSTSRTVECYRTTRDENFTCVKACGRKKNCGRHRCSERCCPLFSSNNLLSGDWDPHFCQMACGKKLRCGQHSCESLCHRGHCPPCLETIFTDLTCACGRTSFPPPLPCGTPPSCQLPCSVPQPCGHSASHSCHLGDCPPCLVPIAKECIGGHVVLRNVPCSSKDIRCNKLCGKTRQCGMHACGRTCHPAPCDTACSSEAGSKASCGQVCGALRRGCRHTCTALCHPSSLCPDVRCGFPVTITCSCGWITASVPCDAGGSSTDFNSDTVYEASIVQKLPAPLQPVEVTGKKISLGQRKLMCDDECSRMERKRVLADAFDIPAPNLNALHFGDSAVSELLADLYGCDPKWVLSVEERCKFLVLGNNRGSTYALNVHVFCPMPKDKRDAVRLIAGRWKLAVNRAGWEPKRFIVVHVTPKSKPPPRVIGVRGGTTVNAPHPPVFDPLVDMDPRLVVSFLDLPRASDISALVLRFGGECELVWLNDKNALAVFSDPARAATATRRLDHGSIYYGAVVVQNGGALSASATANTWGGGLGTVKEVGALSSQRGNLWKKAVVQEMAWREDSRGDVELSADSGDVLASAWKGKEAPISASINRWSVLDSETSSNLSAASVSTEEPAKWLGNHSNLGAKSSTSTMNLAGQPGSTLSETKLSKVVDNCEKTYD